MTGIFTPRNMLRALVLLPGLVHAPSALAHASLLRSEPAARVIVAKTPEAIKLHFNEPVSPLRLQFFGPKGVPMPLARVAADGATIDAIPPARLGKGTYLLSWRVVSADGHPVGGSFTFSIGERSAEGPAPPQADVDASAQDALWVAKILLYLGLFVGIGGAFHRAFLTTPVSRRMTWAMAGLLAVGACAAAGSIGLQGLDALALPLSRYGDGAVWTAGFFTSYGSTGLIAAAAQLAALLSLFLARPLVARLLAIGALVGAGAALAASGHASAAEPQTFMRPAVMLHALCVALWIGALPPLAMALLGPYEDRAAALELFKRTIPIAIVLLVATGAGLAFVQLGSIEALWTTDYGQVLFRKLVCVTLLFGLAALNRFYFAPAVEGGDDVAPRRFIFSIAAELAIVLVILGLVASWRFTPPPRALAAAAEEPVFMHFHTEQAMVDFSIEPLRDGRREIAIKLLNGEFAPLDAKELTLVLSKPDIGIEPLRAAAVQTGDNNWRIADLEIPMAGRWRARFEILISDFEKVSIEDDIELVR